MSLASLETAIWHEAQQVLSNPKLKKSEVLAWSSGDPGVEEGEVLIHLPGIGVNICVSEQNDKRAKEGQS